jgi:hypothetical protein
MFLMRRRKQRFLSSGSIRKVNVVVLAVAIFSVRGSLLCMYCNEL